MLGVIACPITSGDTAFRSARLVLSDWFKIDQKKWKNRLLLCVPVLGVGEMCIRDRYSPPRTDSPAPQRSPPGSRCR